MTAPEPLLPPVIASQPAGMPATPPARSAPARWVRVYTPDSGGGTVIVALPDPLPPVADGWTRAVDDRTVTDTEVSTAG